ncbi:MAG: hypothetical protein DI630_29340 [Gordonia sp. (in: high G+C Gram-positive bacteria)]|nr:MAG: hypothetical protein DI630_29340 [Gordonia sp. (in: high G+C Gram-positive bacteria)]
MTVEFRMGHQDHNKVEDFLSRKSAGVGAIAMHSSAARHQIAAAEAAREAGVDVLYDPRTERLSQGGYGLEKIPGYLPTPYDLETLARSHDDRAVLVDAVLTAHPEVTTLITPPSFFTDCESTALLNLALAETARLGSDKPVRPTITLSTRLGINLVRQIAREYSAARFEQIDVRFSPLGGENDGLRKIKAAFKALRAFKEQGLEVTLGQSGNIGQAAVALGHADHYSVGIGQWESVNHAQTIQRQSKPPKLDSEGKRIGGAWEGVYLPGLAMTVSKKVGEALLGHSDVRTRVGCRVDGCATSIKGPLSEHRTHYLHSRAAEMENLMLQPPTWRAKSEMDRITRAIELRQLINRKYRSPQVPELKTRTLESLLGEGEAERAVAVA